MHQFDYRKPSEELLTPKIVGMLCKLYQYQGRQEFLLESHINKLQKHYEAALIQSAGASSRIEGIFIREGRLEELPRHKADPANRFEQEITGCRDVLTFIYEKRADLPLRPIPAG